MGPRLRGDDSVMYHVYILASRPYGTLYIGVTNNLGYRLQLHRAGQGSEFVKQYNVRRLVYVEPYENAEDAIRREKQLKKMESRLEDQTDRRGQSGMARPQSFDRVNVLARSLSVVRGRFVVPAQAGTHKPRIRIRAKSAKRDYGLAAPKRHGVWVPAFAGTTMWIPHAGTTKAGLACARKTVQ
jgi:putative endonuclease